MLDTPATSHVHQNKSHNLDQYSINVGEIVLSVYHATTRQHIVMYSHDLTQIK